MSTQLRALCRPELAAGFALAGIPTIEADTASSAVARIREIIEDPTIGVVLLEDTFHQQLPDDLRRQLARQPLPMVVPFPGLAWDTAPGAAESYIVELLRQVIGYRVRLR